MNNQQLIESLEYYCYKLYEFDRQAYGKVYREANKGKEASRKAAWYQANKDQIKAKQAVYHQANKDQIKAKQAAYYQNNKRKLATQNKAYREREKKSISALDDYYANNSDEINKNDELKLFRQRYKDMFNNHKDNEVK